MLSPDERAGAEIKLRALRSGLDDLSAAESSAERALFTAERAFAQALKLMRNAHTTFKGAQRNADEVRKSIDDVIMALEAGDWAALGGFDIGIPARVHALVVQDLTDITPSRSEAVWKPAANTLGEVFKPISTLVPGNTSRIMPLEIADETRHTAVHPADAARSAKTARDRRTSEVNIAHCLPVELVAEVFRVTAELCVEADRNSVLNIIESCTMGYQAATPILYRTLLMTLGRAQLVMRVFDNQVPRVTTGSILGANPAKRLCPLVRRLCVTEIPTGFTREHIRCLTRLVSLYDSKLMGPFFNMPLPPTLKHFREWTCTWPQKLPAMLTHVTLFYPIGSAYAPSPVTVKAYITTQLPVSLTHFALSFSNSLVSPSNAEEGIRGLLLCILARKNVQLVVIRLFRHAADMFSYQLVLRAFGALPLQDHERVAIWRDLRQGLVACDYNPVIADAVANRTPFTEAQPFRQEERPTTSNVERESGGHKGGRGRLKGGRGRGGRR